MSEFFSQLMGLLTVTLYYFYELVILLFKVSGVME